MLELPCEVERPAGDAIQGVGLSGSQWQRIRGQISLTLRISYRAIVEADIPAGQHVAPLHSGTRIDSICRCCQRIARGACKYVEGERPVETVAVIEHADAEQGPAADVIRLQRYAEVLMSRDAPAGAQSEVGPGGPFRVETRLRGEIEVDEGAVIVGTGAHVELITLRAVPRESCGFGVVVTV